MVFTSAADINQRRPTKVAPIPSNSILLDSRFILITFVIIFKGFFFICQV